MSKKHRTKQTAHQPQPQWQPIEMLATFAPHIDGMLASSQEQYETLLPARSKPHVLDDSTVNRIITVFTEQIGDLWLFDMQLQRWATEQITASQRAEVERLQGQMKTLRETDEQVLALARELSKGTIEKIMETIRNRVLVLLLSLFLETDVLDALKMKWCFRLFTCPTSRFLLSLSSSCSEVSAPRFEMHHEQKKTL